MSCSTEFLFDILFRITSDLDFDSLIGILLATYSGACFAVLPVFPANIPTFYLAYILALIIRRFSQNVRFMNVSKKIVSIWKHQRTSFLTTLKGAPDFLFQLLQARVTHFLQLCTFAFGCPNK